MAELGGSEFAEAVLGVVAGRPPALDLEREAALQRLLVGGAERDLLAAAHDCGDGGLAIALAESAIEGGTGFAVTVAGPAAARAAVHRDRLARGGRRRRGEAAEFEALAAEHGVPVAMLGETGGPRVVFDGLFEIGVDEARALHEDTFPKLLAG